MASGERGGRVAIPHLARVLATAKGIGGKRVLTTERVSSTRGSGWGMGRGWSRGERIGLEQVVTKSSSRTGCLRGGDHVMLVCVCVCGGGGWPTLNKSEVPNGSNAERSDGLPEKLPPVTKGEKEVCNR